MAEVVNPLPGLAWISGEGRSPDREQAEGFWSICETLPGWISAGDEPAAPDWPEGTWRLFPETVMTHGVAPLLHRSLGGASWLPEPYGAWLEYQYLQNRRRTERLFANLGRILEAARVAGVPMMPLKGPLLAERFYGEPALRPMNDLDLFVRVESFQAAEQVLFHLGYERVFDGWKHTKLALPGNREMVDETCEHPDNPRVVELHPFCREKLGDEIFDLTERLWGSAAQGELAGEPAWLPSPAELWLYLLLHGNHHVLLNNFRLVQLVDLQAVGPAVEEPEEILAALDPRATAAVLGLLARYCPSSCASGLVASQRSGLDPGFSTWVARLDLFGVSYLNPAVWRAH